MVQGFFFLKIMAANDSEYLASQPQSSALVFRGFEAPGKQAGGLFSVKNGPAGPGIGGGAYQQALCAWFYQRPACSYYHEFEIITVITKNILSRKKEKRLCCTRLFLLLFRDNISVTAKYKAKKNKIYRHRFRDNIFLLLC